MKDGSELASMLAQYRGGDDIYRHSLNRSVVYTSGARAFFQNAGGGAYWLLDILASEPTILNHVRTDGFGAVRLKVDTSSAVLTVTDGNNKTEPVFRQTIANTDCPIAPCSERRKDGACLFFHGADPYVRSPCDHDHASAGAVAERDF